MAQNGNNIIVSVYQNGTWTAIAGTKSDEIHVNGEKIPISSATDSQWEHNIMGRMSWTLNVSWLVSAVADIRKLLMVNTRVQIRIGERSYSASTGMKGYAYISDATIRATKGSLCMGSFVFSGDGPLEEDSQ